MPRKSKVPKLKLEDKPKIKKEKIIPKGLRVESLKDWEIVSYADFSDDTNDYNEPAYYIILPTKFNSFKYGLKLDPADCKVDMLHCENTWKYKLERLPEAKAKILVSKMQYEIASSGLKKK